MVLSKNLGGVKVTGNVHNEVKKLRRNCEERRFDNAVKAHNRSEKHIDPHQMLISSMHGVAAGNTLRDDDGS